MVGSEIDFLWVIVPFDVSRLILPRSAGVCMGFLCGLFMDSPGELPGGVVCDLKSWLRSDCG